MTPKQHEKWLRKNGVHPDQIKARKGTVKLPRYQGVKAHTNYYDNKGLEGNSPIKAATVLDQMTPKERKVAERALFVVEEESRTSPRDLGGEREYCAKEINNG